MRYIFPRPRFSVALPLGINGSRTRSGQRAKTTLTGLPVVAGASVGTTSSAKWRPYAGGGFGPRGSTSRRSLTQNKPQPTAQSSSHSVKFGLSPTPPRRSAPGRQGRRPLRSHKHRPIMGSSPPAVSATSSVELQSAARGGGELRDSASRKSSAQSKAQIQAPFSAQRGGKTVTGFPARRTSTPQFSVPYPPHCGSAIAPPRFSRACAIHLNSAHRRNS